MVDWNPLIVALSAILLALAAAVPGYLAYVTAKANGRQSDRQGHKQDAQNEALLEQGSRIHANGARLETAVAENTDISTQAFHEANTVNIKLEKLGLAHQTALLENTAAMHERLSTIAAAAVAAAMAAARTVADEARKPK